MTSFLVKLWQIRKGLVEVGTNQNINKKDNQNFNKIQEKGSENLYEMNADERCFPPFLTFHFAYLFYFKYIFSKQKITTTDALFLYFKFQYLKLYFEDLQFLKLPQIEKEKISFPFKYFLMAYIDKFTWIQIH